MGWFFGERVGGCDLGSHWMGDVGVGIKVEYILFLGYRKVGLIIIRNI